MSSSRSKAQLAAPILLILFFMTVTAVWLHLNRGPTQFDDSWYLIDSLKMFDALSGRGIIGWLHEFFAAQDRVRAPLICALPTPFYFIFGRIPKAAFWVNLAFMPVLLGGVYAIARRFCTPRVALLALFITASMPEFYGLAEHFYVEYGLTALTALAVWLLVSSDDLTRTGRVIAFSAVCGLGCLQKILFPAYVLLLVIYVAGRWARRLARLPAGGDGLTPWPLATVAALVIPAALIAGPWYAINFRTAIGRAIFSGFDPVEANRFGTGDPFTAGAVVRYGLKIVNEGIGGAYGLIGVLAVVVLMLPWGKKKNQKDSSLPSKPSTHRAPSFNMLLILWLIPIAGFALATNKEIRFISPMLPGVAILLAIGIDCLIQKFGLAGVVTAICFLAFALICQMQNSFQPFGQHIWSIPFHNAQAEGGRSLRFAANRIGPANVVERDEWPLRKVIDESLDTLQPGPGQIPTVVYASDTMHINRVNLQLAADQARLPIAFATTSYDPPGPIIAGADLVLFRTGGETLKGYEQIREASARAIAGQNLQATPSPIEFPDGGKLLLYRRRIGIESCDVQFQNHIRLTGLSISQVGKNMNIQYRWTCDAPVTGPCKFFTHIVDPTNAAASLFYLDAGLMFNQPLVEQWKPGEIHDDVISQTIPALSDDRLAAVDIGSYLPGSNELVEIKIPDLASHPGWSLLGGSHGVHIDLNGRIVR